MKTTAPVSPPTPVSATPSVLAAGTPAATRLAEERALLDRVAGQDPQAFVLLYTRYAARVRRYLRRRLGPTDLVDEVLQEVLLVLWQQPSACPPTVPLLPRGGLARHWTAPGRALPASCCGRRPPAGWPAPWTCSRSTNAPHSSCWCSRAARIGTLQRCWRPPSARCARASGGGRGRPAAPPTRP